MARRGRHPRRATGPSRSWTGTARARRPPRPAEGAAAPRRRGCGRRGAGPGGGARAPACASQGGRERVRAFAAPRRPSARARSPLGGCHRRPHLSSEASGCAARSNARASPPPAPPLVFVRARRPEERRPQAGARPGVLSAGPGRGRRWPRSAGSGGGGLGGACAR